MKRRYVQVEEKVCTVVHMLYWLKRRYTCTVFVLVLVEEKVCTVVQLLYLQVEEKVLV